MFMLLMDMFGGLPIFCPRGLPVFCTFIPNHRTDEMEFRILLSDTDIED